MGLLDWFRRRPAKAIPEALWAKTIAAYPFLATLAVDEQKQLETLSAGFLAEKEFSAAGDLQLTDEICLAIAAQACLPILNLGLAAYGDWVGVVVYPEEFVVPRHIEDAAGVVHEYDDVLSGEAWSGGPLLVSWHDVQMAGNGYNVVIHEFAHKLDMLNGEADGIPALHSAVAVDDWKNVFFSAFDDFCTRVDAGEETRIDPYASEAPEEFFAVLSEVFFEHPVLISEDYPALYDLLRRYYRQDPLARLSRQQKIAHH